MGSFPVDAQPHNARGGGLAEAVAHAHVRGLAGERGAARRQADRTAGVAARRDHATRVHNDVVVGVAAHLGRTQHRHHVVAVGVATGVVDAEQIVADKHESYLGETSDLVFDVPVTQARR